MRTAKVVGARVMYADQERRRRPLMFTLKHFAAKGKALRFFSGGGDPFFPKVQRERRRWQAPKAVFSMRLALKPRSRDRGQVCLLV